MKRRARTHHLGPGETLRAVADGTDAVTSDGSLRRIRSSVAPTQALRAAPFDPRKSEWVVWTQWRNATPTSLTEFRATWTVPEPPAVDGGQTIYMFPGLQDDHRTLGGDSAPNILQPVLQWQTTDPGAPQGWSIASWYVRNDSQGFVSEAVPVQPGDSVESVMLLEDYDSDRDRYSYRCEFVGYPQTVLRAQLVEQLIDCSIVLECAALSACDQFPNAGATTFESVTVRTENVDPGVDWKPSDPWQPCGQRIAVSANGSVDARIVVSYR